MSRPEDPNRKLDRPTSSLERICPKCGMANPNGAKRCSNCGAWTAPTPEPISKGILVALFVIIGLPALLAGGCFILVGASNAREFVTGLGLIFFVVGIALIALFCYLLKLAFMDNDRDRR